MFLLVPAHPGSHGQRAVKWLLLRVLLKKFRVSDLHFMFHSFLLQRYITVNTYG